MCSSQFNLTLMFLNSFVVCFLGLILFFHLLVNCLRVVSIDCLYVCRVCFVCVSHQWCTVDRCCVSSASEWPCLRKIGGFSFFFKKNGLTSGLTRDLRQVSDVIPTTPDGLTSDRQVGFFCFL
jgi:hypothetical protein